MSVCAKAKPFGLHSIVLMSRCTNKMSVHAKAKPFWLHSIVLMSLVSISWLVYIIGSTIQLSATNPINTTHLKETTSFNLTNTTIQETTRRSPILPKPLAWCPKANVPSTSVGTHVLEQSFEGNPNQNWGNILSPYWAGRAMAELGGYDYNGNHNTFGRGTWMEFLPTSAPARVPNKDVFDKVCNKCNRYRYYHELPCIDGWSHIAPEIMINTQEAL